MAKLMFISRYIIAWLIFLAWFPFAGFIGEGYAYMKHYLFQADQMH